MNLPIDIIPNTSPPMFKWRQVIDTPVGQKVQEHQGMMVPSVESAIIALIGITKQLKLECSVLKEKLQAEQSKERKLEPETTPLTVVTKKGK